MRPIVTDVPWPVFVCLLVTTVSCAKMAEPVEMLFWGRVVWTQLTMCRWGQDPNGTRQFWRVFMPAKYNVWGLCSGECAAAMRLFVKLLWTLVIIIRHGTGSLGHRVSGSFESSFTSGSQGHRFYPVWDPSFSGFRKNAQNAKRTLKCWNYKSHCQVSVVGLKSPDISPCNELLLLPMIVKKSLSWEYFFTHKSTFGVHYRTGSPGQLGFRVAGLPGHWVAGSQNVTQFHLCWTVNANLIKTKQ